LLSGTKTAGRSSVRREARVAGVDDDFEHLVVRSVDVEQVHARCRHHDVAGRHVGHADHAFEHRAALGVDQLTLFGVGQGLDQLVLAVGAGRDELHHALEEAALFDDGGAGRVWVGHCGGVG
jgi:hypothetical protein